MADNMEAVRRAFREEPRLGPGFDLAHIDNGAPRVREADMARHSRGDGNR
jgi:hypothetical protein